MKKTENSQSEKKGESWKRKVWSKARETYWKGTGKSGEC